MRKLKTHLVGLWNYLFVTGNLPSEIEGTNPFEVKIIRDDTDSLSEAIGLSSKRRSELERLAAASVAMTRRISDAINVASKECKHPNELFFVSFIIGEQIARNHSPLGGLFEKFLERRRREQEDDDGN